MHQEERSTLEVASYVPAIGAELVDDLLIPVGHASGLLLCSGLGPVDDEVAFGEVPAPVELDESVEVAERRDHDLSTILLGVDVVGDRLALTRRAVPIDGDGALPVEMRGHVVPVQAKTGVSASRPSSTYVGSVPSPSM